MINEKTFNEFKCQEKKQDPKLKITNTGIPESIAQSYIHKRIDSLYPWQRAAFEEGINGNNLVFSAPTSGGKSLVAELLMILRMCQYDNTSKAMFILPYVSIISEKTYHLQYVLFSTNFKVAGYYSKDSKIPFSNSSYDCERIAICTAERANLAFNRYKNEGLKDELCCIVIDEAHMISDSKRGPSLEMLLSKVRLYCHNCQIICMSATMGGMEVFSEWLSARLFITDHRPIRIKEYIVIHREIYMYDKFGVKHKQGFLEFNECFKLVRKLEMIASGDSDFVASLVFEATSQMESVLIFCARRIQCENCAMLLSKHLPSYIREDTPLHQKRLNLIEKLRDSLAGHFNNDLEKCILKGIAFHHAGLTKEERECVEFGFKEGIIQVLTATSTLAAGVNLPAHRVILRSIKQGRENIKRSLYLQMAGRVGRGGHVKKGDVFVMSMNHGIDRNVICTLIQEPLPHLQSQLLPMTIIKNHNHQIIKDKKKVTLSREEIQFIQQVLLELIANTDMCTVYDIDDYFRSTLLNYQINYRLLHSAIYQSLVYLKDAKLIKWIFLSDDQKVTSGCDNSRKIDGYWQATPDGHAIESTGLNIDVAMRLQSDIKHFMNFAILDLKHLLYVAMTNHPFDITDWDLWSCILEKLSPSDKRIAEILDIKIDDAYKASCSNFGISPDLRFRHSRFLSACALAHVIENGSLQSAEEIWCKEGLTCGSKASRGALQELQLEVGKRAEIIVRMCSICGWWQAETIFSQVSLQVINGCSLELMELMKINGMTPQRARFLYKANIRNAENLIGTSDRVLRKCLREALPANFKGSASKSKNWNDIEFSGLNAMIERAIKSLKENASKISNDMILD